MSKDKEKDNIKKSNDDLLRRMKNPNDNLRRYCPTSTWFPPRPNPGKQFKKKEKNNVNRVGCPSCGCMEFEYEILPEGTDGVPMFYCLSCKSKWTAGNSGEPYISWRFCRRKKNETDG